MYEWNNQEQIVELKNDEIDAVDLIQWNGGVIMNPKRLAILRDEREMEHRIRESALKEGNRELYSNSNKIMIIEETV